MIINEGLASKKIKDATAISKEIGYNEIAYVNNNEKVIGDMPVSYINTINNYMSISVLPEGNWEPLKAFKDTLITFSKTTDRALYLNQNGNWEEVVLPISTESDSLWLTNNECAMILPYGSSLSNLQAKSNKILITIDGKNWIATTPGVDITITQKNSNTALYASGSWSSWIYKLHDLIVYNKTGSGINDSSEGYVTKNG